jgi:hypothetical protein
VDTARVEAALGMGGPCLAAAAFWDGDLPKVRGWRTTRVRTTRQVGMQAVVRLRDADLARFVPELMVTRLAAMGLVDAASARQGLNPTWRVLPGGMPDAQVQHWKVPWEDVAPAAEAWAAAAGAAGEVDPLPPPAPVWG